MTANDNSQTKRVWLKVQNGDYELVDVTEDPARVVMRIETLAPSNRIYVV